jgi:hypothetical protein
MACHIPGNATILYSYNGNVFTDVIWFQNKVDRYSVIKAILQARINAKRIRNLDNIIDR